MKKRNLLLIIGISLLLSACSKNSSEVKPVSKIDKEGASYEYINELASYNDFLV